MLLVDSFPGSICGDQIRDKGAELQSTLTSDYDVCVITFHGAVGLLASQRLMLHFEQFHISDHSVQLMILEVGTTNLNVRFYFTVSLPLL